MKKSTSKNSARVPKKTEPFYIDGCKVMVRYQKENNPQVVQSVRSILVSAAASVKNCGNLQ